MKKLFTFFSFLTLLLLVNHSFAQTPNWLWGVAQQGGSCYTSSFGIGADKNTGDIFVGGRVVSGMTLGGIAVNGTGVWSARLNTSGVAKWVVVHSFPGSTGANYMYGFGKDDSDNSYAAGLINSGGGWYVDKYDSSGNQRWAYSGTGGSPYGVAGDKAGNAYVTGNFGGTMSFGNGVTLTSKGSNDVFIAKYDNWGNCVWAKNYGGPGDDFGRGIQIDQGGNIVIIGNYSNGATFGSITPPSVGGTDPYEFFIMKADSGGTPLWIATGSNAGVTGSSFSFWQYAAMGIDSCGNVYTSGHFSGTAQFGSLPSITSPAGNNVFIAKCLDDGNWEWVKNAGSASGADGEGFAFDKNNDVYMTGSVYGTATFGTQTVSTPASGSLFIAKFANSNGDCQWVQDVPGTVGTAGSNLAIDNRGYVYAIGGMENNTTTIGSSTVSGTASCGQNILIVKLDTVPPLNIIPHPNPSYCAGSTTNLPFDITGSFNGSNTFTAELSDSSGSFVLPDTLGSFSSISGGQINITIPGNVTPGTKYVIRIVSSNPATSSRYYCNSFSTSPIQTTYATVTISNGSALTVTPDTTMCTGTSINLNVSGGSNYTWTPSIGLTCTNCSNPTASPTSSQTYMVTANAGSACAGSSSIVINVLPGVNLVTNPAGDTSICGGRSVQLSASGAATYSWSSSATINCSSCNSNLVTPTADSTAYIVTGTSADGKCSASKQLNIYLGNNARGGIISAPRDTLCQGTPGRLTLNNYQGSPIQWQSSTDDTNFTNINTTDTSNHKTSPLFQTTWYRVTIGNGSCVATSDTIQLFVPPTLMSKFDYSASNLAVTFNSDSSSGNIRTYTWNFGDNSPSSNDADPTHTFPKDTTYYVCLTLYDGSNCSYTFCRYISGLTGVNTVNAAGYLVIYPNPVTEQLTISDNGLLRNAYSIEMYDVLGRMVKNWNGAMINMNPVTLNVSTLTKGMYYLKIRTEKSDYVQKIVKE